MTLVPSVCYRAVQARDARYDGRFFTCVKTTRIYCRPICPARPPKLENCSFVPTVAAAQSAGFRPCLRCRPESSPDLDAWRGTSATVSRALKLTEGGALDDADVASLAERLQIGERQLRRLFQEHIGANPVTVAQTRRVLLAKQLIHQTDLSMVEVALASGFGSVRRFNETFQRLYHRPPSQLRNRAATVSSAPEISLLLPYRPPYNWPAMLRFLQKRAITGLEVVSDDTYSRAIALGDTAGTLQVSHAPEQSALRVIVRFPRLGSLSTIIARVRRMFDLSTDPGAIASALCSDAILAPLVKAQPGLRVPGGWDGFEIAVRAVLGQQITVKGATQLAGRVVAELGEPISDDAETAGIKHVFPHPERFTIPVLTECGITKARAATLVAVAGALIANPRLFDPRRDLDQAVAQMRNIPRIGEWTAQYIAMRVLGESDAFLANDVAVRRAFAINRQRPGAAELRRYAQRWRPWRAYAVMHLWTAGAVQTLSMKENDHALTA